MGSRVTHAFWVVDEVGWICVAGMVVGGGHVRGIFIVVVLIFFEEMEMKNKLREREKQYMGLIVLRLSGYPGVDVKFEVVVDPSIEGGCSALPSRWFTLS